MKNPLKVFAALLVLAVFSNTAMAQVKLIGNTAGAELVQVLTVTNTTPLYFGRVGITAGTAGTVIMTTAGVRTAGASTTTIVSNGIGTPKTVALFTLGGTDAAIYTIGLPLTIPVTTTAGTGDNTMDIDALMVNVDGAGEATAVGATGTLVSGASSFLMAGTLNISTTQILGVYAGTYDVTVDYQ